MGCAGNSKNVFSDLSVMPDSVAELLLKTICIVPTFLISLCLSHWLIRSELLFADLIKCVITLVCLLYFCKIIVERLNGVKSDKSGCLFLYILPAVFHTVGIIGSPTNSWWATIVEFACLLVATICCIPIILEFIKNNNEKMAAGQLEDAEKRAREGQSPKSMVEIQTDYVLYSTIFVVFWILINILALNLWILFSCQAPPNANNLIPKTNSISQSLCPIAQLQQFTCHNSEIYSTFNYLNLKETPQTYPETNTNEDICTAVSSESRNQIIYVLSISIQTPISMLSFAFLIGLVVYYLLLAFDRCLSKLEFTDRSEERTDYLHNSLGFQGPQNVGTQMRAYIIEFTLSNQNILALSSEERYFHFLHMPLWLAVVSLITFVDLLIARLQVASINGLHRKYVLSVFASFMFLFVICSGSGWALRQIQLTPDAPFFDYYWCTRTKISLSLIGFSCAFALLSFVCTFLFRGREMAMVEIIISEINNITRLFMIFLAIKLQLEALFQDGFSWYCWNLSPLLALFGLLGAFTKFSCCVLVSLMHLYESDREPECSTHESELDTAFVSRVRDSKVDPEECTICHEPFNLERLHEVARTRCPKGHYFHTYCLNRWLVLSSGTTASGLPRTPACPQCVQPINGVDQLFQVQNILIGKELEKDAFKHMASFFNKYITH